MTADDVVVEHDVMIAMRDGTRLRTDIYRRAKSPEPAPVLLFRYPYPPLLYGRVDEALQLAQQGYVAVVQHCRGRFGSEGQYDFVRDDIDDGYDMVEWAAVQPWSNGKVAMYGASYGGFTQWTAAMAQPPHLVAIAPNSSSWRYFDNDIWYRSPGVLALGIAYRWCGAQAGWEATQRGVTPAPMVPLSATVVREQMPLRDVPQLELAPFWQDWCDRTDPDDPYWVNISAANHKDRIEIPVFQAVGWYDYFIGGALHAFTSLSETGAPERVRHGQRLVIGPWTHTGSPPPRHDLPADLPPLRDYSPGSPVMRFYAHYLNGDHPDYEDEAPIRLFVMGENVWRDEREWPLARTQFTPFHLRSGGNANTARGDGVLSVDAPGAEPADEFDFDPADPVVGSVAYGGDYDDIVDLKVHDRRDDVLVYSSAPLDTPLEVTGPVRVELWAASSAVNTDFTAKLVDVFPDGTPVLLCQGIVRSGGATGGLIEPGHVYRYDIDLFVTSNLFGAGHRIRLHVSSSEFPTYELNPNTGRRITHDPSGEMVVAHQRVLHDAEHPSRLILPVIPR